MFGKKKPAEPARRTVVVNRPTPEPFSYYRSNRRVASGAEARRTEQEAAGRPNVAKLVKLGIVLVIVIVALFKVLFVSGSPNVVVADQYNVYREEAAYKTAVAQAIAGSNWHSNKLTFDDTAIQTAILEQLPEVAQVEIIIPLINNRPVVKLTLLPPGLLVRSNRETFVIASSGRVVTKQSAATASLTVPQLTDESTTEYKVGEYGFSELSVQFITELKHQMTAKQVGVSKWTVPAGGIAELRMIPANERYAVKFDINGDVLQQAGTYLAARQALETQGLQPKEYIDARVVGKAYIK